VPSFVSYGHGPVGRGENNRDKGWELRHWFAPEELEVGPFYLFSRAPNGVTPKEGILPHFPNWGRASPIWGMSFRSLLKILQMPPHWVYSLKALQGNRV